MLKAALRVLEGWGFEYKTHIIWHKLRPGAQRGTGYWVSGEHELLLIGTRGAPPAPAPGTQWPSLIAERVGEHSAKPSVFHDLIEEYFPSLPKIELNARIAREGWDRWGYEAPEDLPAEASEGPHPGPLPEGEGVLAPEASAETLEARRRAVTDGNGLVRLAGRSVAAEFVIASEIAEAEALMQGSARSLAPSAAGLPASDQPEDGSRQQPAAMAGEGGGEGLPSEASP
jgi:hypothetical protein